MDHKKLYNKLKLIIFRNYYLAEGIKSKQNIINLDYYRSDINLGDVLSTLIFDYMLMLKGIDKYQKTKKTGYLLCVGSLLGGRGLYDATVWGTGTMSFFQVYNIMLWKKIRKLDIRSVRGPITHKILTDAGYNCPEIYGDPAILMPDIYNPVGIKKEYEVLYIPHFSQKSNPFPSHFKMIDIQTKDYRYFIDEICKAKKVITSSLHGIILAESYGVPAVFYAKDRDAELLKYYDWYYSTNRYNVVLAHTIEEAEQLEPMPLPDLSQMRENIKNVFPYDLWY